MTTTIDTTTPDPTDRPTDSRHRTIDQRTARTWHRAAKRVGEADNGSFASSDHRADDCRRRVCRLPGCSLRHRRSDHRGQRVRLLRGLHCGVRCGERHSHPHRRSRAPHHPPDVRRRASTRQSSSLPRPRPQLGSLHCSDSRASPPVPSAPARWCRGWATPPTIPATIVWAIGFAVLAGILGLGIGLIARQSAAAISGVLVWWLVIENLVSVFASERVVRFMPFVAGNGMLDDRRRR